MAVQAGSFLVGDAVKQGWALMKRYYWGLLKILLVIVAVNVVFAVVGELFDEGIISGLASLIFWFIYMFLMLNMVRMILSMVDGMELGIEELFKVNWRMFWSYVGFNLLVSVVILVPMFFVSMLALASIGGIFGLAGFFDPGLAESLQIFGVVGGVLGLLIVIGLVYLSVALSQGQYLIVDKAMGPIAAFKASWAITKGVKLRLVALGFVLTLINLLGLLALFIGLLVTIPLSIFATYWVYRQLSARLGESAAGTNQVKQVAAESA